MELKILCSCGTKFKFDVEPVNGRMPAPVSCPECGADATDQANTVLRSMASPAAPVAASAPIAPSSAPGPAAVTPAPMRVVLPGLPTVLAPTLTSTPAPGGLRITKHAEPIAATPTESSDAEAPPKPPFPLPLGPVAAREGKPKSQLVKTLTTIGTVIVVLFGIWAFGFKWYKRIRTVVNVTAGLSEGDDGKGDSAFEGGPKNLWYDKCAMLFIKHTNHLAVAEACRAYWKEKLHKQLTDIHTQDTAEQAGEFELISSHNGWVRLLGTQEWPVPQHEALAQYLSEKFGTMIFEFRTESFADTYHFGVFDQGKKKFHAQMDIIFRKVKGEGSVPAEIVTTTGDEFAKANGYKPKKDQQFDVLDADKVTQRLGMKLWDEKEGTELKGMFLKETGPAM